MLVMISRLEGFDKELEEASLDLGESAWATFRRVTLPLAMPGIVASMLLCFTTSFDESCWPSSSPATSPTLPVYIWGQLRLPTQLPNVLALGSCILAASFVFVFLSERLRRRGWRRHDVPTAGRRCVPGACRAIAGQRGGAALRIVAPRPGPDRPAISGVSRPRWRRRSASASGRNARWLQPPTAIR